MKLFTWKCLLFIGGHMNQFGVRHKKNKKVARLQHFQRPTPDRPPLFLSPHKLFFFRHYPIEEGAPVYRPVDRRRRHIRTFSFACWLIGAGKKRSVSCVCRLLWQKTLTMPSGRATKKTASRSFPDMDIKSTGGHARTKCRLAVRQKRAAGCFFWSTRTS